MKFQILGSIVALATLAAAVPNPLPGSSNTTVRDPALWYNSNTKKYFTFSTGQGIKIFSSNALTGPWTAQGTILPNGSSIALQCQGTCGYWAPDVNYINGRYVLYYSLSSIESQNSAIGVATSPSMESGTWVDYGEVIRSTANTGGTFNAIDPNIIDDGGLKLTFGSYWQGIYQRSLSNITTSTSTTSDIHLTGGDFRPAEGGFVYKSKSSSYYFLLWSYGTTPLQGGTTRPPAGDEYRVLVGRGTSVSGPFYDKAGSPVATVTTPPTGYVLLASHDDVYAPGGQSVTFDPVSGRDVIVYHYVRKSDPVGGPSYLGINYVDFSSGWPVIVD